MVSNIFLTWWSFIAIVLSQLEIALTNIFRGAHRKTACCLLPAAYCLLPQSAWHFVAIPVQQSSHLDRSRRRPSMPGPGNSQC